VVKELDLFEYNYGCELNAWSKGTTRNGRNTTLHGPRIGALHVAEAVRGG
jgi:hypothetical protein